MVLGCINQGSDENADNYVCGTNSNRLKNTELCCADANYLCLMCGRCLQNL